MPIIKEPRPLPSDMSYVPSGTKPYKVSNKDSWWALADRAEVKASGLSANDLCYLNFKTRHPPEINWYLYHKVGCRTPTADGKNYRFSTADSPGIVHLPVPGSPQPVNEMTPVTRASRTNIWVGVGGNAGTQFFVVGIDTMSGVVFSLDEFGKAMVVTASTNRLGPGFGASGGMVVILVSGVSSPDELNGHQEGAWDLNLAIGPKWSSVTKTHKFMPLVKVMQRVAKTPAGLKRVLADPGNWVDFVKVVKGAIEGIGLDSQPTVIVVGVPLAGAGAEASFFFGVSNFNAVWNNE